MISCLQGNSTEEASWAYFFPHCWVFFTFVSKWWFPSALLYHQTFSLLLQGDGLSTYGQLPLSQTTKLQDLIASNYLRHVNRLSSHICFPFSESKHLLNRLCLYLFCRLLIVFIKYFFCIVFAYNTIIPGFQSSKLTKIYNFLSCYTCLTDYCLNLFHARRYLHGLYWG